MARHIPAARIFLVSVSAALCLRCAPGVATVPAMESLPQRPVSIFHADTITYRISFADTGERGRFKETFDRFLMDQRFSADRYDSGGVLTVLRILPKKNGDGAFPEYQAFAAPLQAGVAAAVPDTAPPAGGGPLRLYYPRGLVDYPVATLVDAAPLGGTTSDSGRFSVSNSSPGGVTLKLAPKTVNAVGRTLNALDVIELWTRWIKERPAEGLALFRFCDGIMKYLHNEEAIVLGFSAQDKSSIRIKLTPQDPQALDRLRSPRLLPAPFKLGSYALKYAKGNDAVLSPNPAAAGDKPLVNELTIRCGGDANPLLSFSLGRYDAVMLWSARDIEYGRRTLMKNSTCSLIGRDRYFVACALEDPAARAFIRSALSGRELLGSFVKAEGTLITAVETDSAPQALLPQAAAPAPMNTPVTILFRKDDAVSTIIAERLLASLARAGIQGGLAASSTKDYEEALVNRGYACAVGWAPESVLFDKSEKLRLASMFFLDDPDEEKRIGENREIPLFSIDWYLLAKTKVGLFKGKLSGIYVKQDAR
jgi:hypothetical protein